VLFGYSVEGWDDWVSKGMEPHEAMNEKARGVLDKTLGGTNFPSVVKFEPRLYRASFLQGLPSLVATFSFGGCQK